MSNLFCPRYSIGNSGWVMDFALHCVGFFSLGLSQIKAVLGFKN